MNNLERVFAVRLEMRQLLWGAVLPVEQRRAEGDMLLGVSGQGGRQITLFPSSACWLKPVKWAGTAIPRRADLSGPMVR